MYGTYLKVICYSASATITQCPSTLITNPAMDSSPTTIKPTNMLKPKIIPQTNIHNLDCHVHHLPTDAANICSRAATFPNTIIISKIDIKDQFTLARLKFPHSAAA